MVEEILTVAMELSSTPVMGLETMGHHMEAIAIILEKQAVMEAPTTIMEALAVPTEAPGQHIQALEAQ
ncbi:unnamed protein product, partial [Allacma fusca]